MKKNDDNGDQCRNVMLFFLLFCFSVMGNCGCVVRFEERFVKEHFCAKLFHCLDHEFYVILILLFTSLVYYG